jgi:glycerophosphoryl diester phosphodiesterase
VQLPALVEIKRADPLRVVWAVEERARAPFAVASFDPATIRAVAASGTRRALILGEDGISAQAPEQDMLARAESARADFLVIQKGLATAGAVAALAEKLAPSFVWDVDDAPTLAVIAREEGVAAVVTDRPDVALRVRDEVS